MAEMRAARDAVGEADLVELRLDSVADPDVDAALEGRRTPVIVTCRPAWEGGSFKGSEEERLRILLAARARGAEFIDVEWQAGFDALVSSNGGRGIVLSQHWFDGVPRDLAVRERAMRVTGAQVVKLAARVPRLGELLPFIELAQTPSEGKRVLIGMGEPGLATRILAMRFGSAWMYAGALAQIGQLSAESLLQDFRFRRIGPETEVYAVAGPGAAASPVPAGQNAFFAERGLDAVCIPLEGDDRAEVCAVAAALGIREVTWEGVPARESWIDA